MKVNSQLIAQFIKGMAEAGELKEWTVAVIGGGEGGRVDFTETVGVNALVRTDKNDGEGSYAIGRLISPRDESIDIDDAAWMAALELTRRAWRSDPARMQSQSEPEAPNGPAIREIRGKGEGNVPAHPERGLLLLYAITPFKDGIGIGEAPVVAMAVSFPGSKAGRKVSYMVNNVSWERDYGASE
jgi:hypothetical protein